MGKAHGHKTHIDGGVHLVHGGADGGAVQGQALCPVGRPFPAEGGVFENGEPFEVGDFTVTAFSVPHDAADPVGYLLEADGRALFVGTDMGYVTENVRAAFARATCAVLEANHDPILLEQSGRPVSLKQRIRGRTGHLANEDAAMLLVETNPPCLKTLLLGHISQECNSRSLARKTFTNALARIGRQDISLSLLDQDAPCDLYEF